jgi:Bpu10I restriction endonuclease
MDILPFPTPHLEKLGATLENEKLPAADKPRIEEAIEHYRAWIRNIESVTGTPDEVIDRLIALLNEYRMYIDVDLVFDSPEDFLYRQKGQLKLDNSVIEEFMPHFLNPAVLPELATLDVVLGPVSSFSAAYFNSSLDAPRPGGGLGIRSKNQDFSIAKPLYLKASHKRDFTESVTERTYLSYVSIECKTNLDKTMFQEACATANDTKAAVAGARYYLLCEYLDMTPQSTAPTDIDEIIILRKAKRLNSNVRSQYSTASKRTHLRGQYIDFLMRNPFRREMFDRLLRHLRELIRNEQPEEESVLGLGYF